ncbi:Rieske (2Fe-2S) protein [Spirillospora albida]|uniref:Rieske (2Fe-2S) protein n=1 Tax=Spirillospora albida TaxID=58123 RepID=UPI0004BFCA2B|nr:Rieske (2Fe-2S) protein [Spirillospora albida]
MAQQDGTAPEQVAPDAGNTRRGVLIGAGLAGAGMLAAACGGGSDEPEGGDAGNGGATGDAGNQGGGGGTDLGAAGAIPVGGGKLFKDEKVVVTQPAAGEFKAFSSVCTHRGCDVNEVAGGTINCKCHGSRFSITDGSVVNPPADRPLDARKVTVEGGKIKLA